MEHQQGYGDRNIPPDGTIERILAREPSVSNPETMAGYILGHMPYLQVHIVAAFNRGIDLRQDPIGVYFTLAEAVSIAQFASATSLSGIERDYSPVKVSFQSLAESDEFSDEFKRRVYSELYARIKAADEDSRP